MKKLLWVFGGLAALLLVTFVGCQSDATRIRATNEAIATPAQIPSDNSTPRPRPTATSTPLSAEISSLDVRVGDCINSTLPEGIRIDTIEIVPCDGPWQYRVLSKFEVPERERYPGNRYFDQQAFENCDRRSTFFLYPLAESWGSENRSVDCLQGSFGLSTLDPGKLDRLVDASSLKTGECLNDAPEAVSTAIVEIVSCDGPWQHRVRSKFEVAESVLYPGDSYFDQNVFENCDRSSTYFLYPSAESWRSGNKSVTCLQESYGLSTLDPGKLDRLVDAFSVKTGECYNEAPETDYVLVEIVSCSDSWDYRVTNTFDITGSGAFPGEDIINQQAYERCKKPLDSYLFPSLESWEFGDRKVLCIVEGL